jgi:RND family efflux transporter MFP subunit
MSHRPVRQREKLQPFLSRALWICGTALFVTQLVTACAEPKPQEGQDQVIRPVRAIQVPDPASIAGRAFTGRARAARRSDLSFEVGGRILKRPIEVGDRVKAGQLLAALDSRDFENRLRAAQANAKQAQAYRDRIAEAHKTGAVSDQRLTDAETELQAAEATVKIRAKALEDSTIYAPYDGSVSAIYVDNFQVVTPQQPVVRVIDAERIQMVVNIPENLVGLAPYVKDIRVRFDALPDQTLAAEIDEIGDEASATTRTYPVTVIMKQPAGFRIEAGMTGHATGRVELPEGTRVPDMFIPAPAVVLEGKSRTSSAHVWVIDPTSKTAAQRAVKVAVATPRGVPVKDGLRPGEWIATAGAHSLQEGQRVEILDASAGEWRVPMPQARTVLAGTATLDAETH